MPTRPRRPWPPTRPPSKAPRRAIGASKAAVENARVQLGYTTIQSPINGRTGNLTVKQGNVVTANNMELMTINEVEPIYVTFAVPEAQLPAIKQYMAGGKLPVRARPQDEPVARKRGSDVRGQCRGYDHRHDQAEGNLPESDHKLWPGEFVRVSLRLTTQQNAVVVPNEAVQTGQNGSFVYVVKQDRTVESRPVTTGARVDQDMVIEKGLEAGETVVTEGQLRLAPGSRVVVRDGRGGGGGEAGAGTPAMAQAAGDVRVAARAGRRGRRAKRTAQELMPHVCGLRPGLAKSNESTRHRVLATSRGTA